MLWIPVTLAAATFQILRTSRQHQLRSVLDTSAAAFCRFAYGAPLALIATAITFGVFGRPFPGIPGRFWLTISIAAVAQIIATVALLAAFKRRDFAIGTVYSKSEVLLVAGLGVLGFGTALRPWGWLGAALVTLGVMWLAAHGPITRLFREAADPAALLGLIAGGGFAVAAVGLGSSSRSLDGGTSLERTLVTLTVMLCLQTALNGAWFMATEPAQLARTAAAWRPALMVGVLSLLGSIGWTWGFTLESAAKVRTLGQVELIIAFVVARLTLGERHTRTDFAASALVLVGIIIVAAVG